MTTITHNAGTIVPSIVDGYTATREARTVVHPILNRSSPDVTLRAPSLRRGSLKCVFGDETDALDAYAVLSVPQVLSLVDTDVPTVSMTFVVAEGDLEIELDDETRNAWIVTIPYVEVTT